MTKLKIDMFSGTLEVEGDDALVRSVYDDFKDRLLAIRPGGDATTDQPTPRMSGTATVSAPASVPALDDGSLKRPPQAARAVGRRRNTVSLSLIKDLDLSDASNDFSLTDFYAAKAPQTAMESNAVFVDYLQQIAQVSGITVDHIYTCYKFAGVKYPNALRQSLADTSSRKNWLDTGSFDNIKLSTAGENFVEHDLPRGAHA